MIDGVFINFDKEGCSLITFEGGGDWEVLSLAGLLVDANGDIKEGGGYMRPKFRRVVLTVSDFWVIGL